MLPHILQDNLTGLRAPDPLDPGVGEDLLQQLPRGGLLALVVKQGLPAVECRGTLGCEEKAD